MRAVPAVDACGIEVIEPLGRSWSVRCACGWEGRGRSETAAQRAGADHVARSLLQTCARARRPLLALAGAQGELHALQEAYSHADGRRGAA